MPEVDFLPYATQSTANVIDQPTYAAATWTPVGFGTGLAQSAEANKVWRQSSFVSAAIATLVSQQLNINVLDDGNLANFVAELLQMLQSVVGSTTGRVRATANYTIYVNAATGNDTNNGTSATTAFATIQRGVNQLTESIDIGAHTAYLSIAAGTYSGNILVGSPIVGQQSQAAFQWITTGGQVVINGAGYCISTAGGAQMTLNGNFLLNCTSTAGQPNSTVLPTGGSRISYTGNQLIFGPAAGCTHIHATTGALFDNASGAGSYTINGGASQHWFASQGGTITVQSAALTLGGTPAFTNFANAVDLGVIDCGALTFPGTAATGARYSITTNGVINTGTAGNLTYLPGNAAGAVASGGQYV